MIFRSALSRFTYPQLRMASTKVCLVVIDGWGLRTETKGNAILAAETPVMDRLRESQGQFLTLDASGTAVGLPEGLMGNSEVGHLNIGAGRAVNQDIDRINIDLGKDRIKTNPNFVAACLSAKGRLHLLGLVSDGGVHGHIDHVKALLKAAQEKGVKETWVHFFADGRDTPPKSAVTYIKDLQNHMKNISYGAIATVMGRYYAMDRDTRWDRIQVAYDGLVSGKGEETSPSGLVELIDGRYKRETEPETDEFLKPIIVEKDGLIRDGDTLVFFNYRADRMREISTVFGQGVGEKFTPAKEPKNLIVYTMTRYDEKFTFPNLYPPIIPVNVLAEVLSRNNVKQYHCAETEKYAHVTYFFNGGQEKEFKGEERKMVPSPKDVPTYDLKPEMNAAGVSDAVCNVISEEKFPFIVCNFANPDMVGHTGKYEPAIKACAATDVGIGKIRDMCEKKGYVLLVTSDHGNAEQMYDEKGGPFTAHTTNRVPFCMTGSHKFITPSHNAALGDVAPTVLALMGIAKPDEMTGQSLLSNVIE